MEESKCKKDVGSCVHCRLRAKLVDKHDRLLKQVDVYVLYQGCVYKCAKELGDYETGIEAVFRVPFGKMDCMVCAAHLRSLLISQAGQASHFQMSLRRPSRLEVRRDGRF